MYSMPYPDEDRFSIFNRRPPKPPAILDDVQAAPLPRPDLDVEARRIAERISRKAREVHRLSTEIQEMAEDFLSRFD